MQRNNIIVNADDFGIDDNRTVAILECFKIGAITHTTAMVNMPYFCQAVDQIKADGLIDRMGLHLNLTEGPPITKGMQACGHFCDEKGLFTGKFHVNYKTRFYLPNNTDEILKAEIKAQIEKFLDCGGERMHLDSHHHVHTDYSVARILFPLLRHYGFKSVRKSRNFGTRLNLYKRLYKIAYNTAIKMCGFVSTDVFCDFGDFSSGWGGLGGQSVEIMVHPMYGSPGALDWSKPLSDSGRLMSEDSSLYRKVSRVDFYD